MNRNASLAIGGAMVVLGAVMLATGAATALSGNEDNPGGAAGALVLFAAVTLAGVWLVRRALRPPALRRAAPRAAVSVLSATAERDLEHRILALAAANGARVTVPQVALRCSVSLEESKAALT